MSYKRVWLHLVWATKNREPYLTKDIRYNIFTHIRKNAQEKGICIDFINGYIDHVHCLISLNSGQSFDKIASLIKGESSRWINENNLTNGRFDWQSDFYVVSVSESVIEKLREYIRDQEIHHQNNSTIREIDKSQESPD